MSNKKLYSNAIRNWPEEDRPREKLLKYGEHTLSNAELIAILIRIGTPGKSAVDIARELLQKFKTLRSLSSMDITEFRQITGLKDAKITQIKAAVELGRRLMSEEKAFIGTVKKSSDVAHFLMPLMRDLKRECFKLLLLDKRNSITNILDIEKGSVDKVSPSIREILHVAIKFQAPGLIIVHNHPSGDIEPSDADKSLTRALVIAASSMELRVFDHIIVGENQHFSFTDKGLIEEYEMLAVSKI